LRIRICSKLLISPDFCARGLKYAGGKTLIFARQRQSLKDWSDFSELLAVLEVALF
jgi:hypothetical protein